MPSFQSAATLCALVLLSACAVPQQSEQLASADTAQSDVVCFHEAPTGSNRKVRRCMSKEDYNKSMDTAQRTASDIKMPPPLQR